MKNSKSKSKRILATAIITGAALLSNVSEAQNSDSIRPFRINIPEAALKDLRQRISATRWPDKETVTDQSQGAQLGKLQQLVHYWGTKYNWRKAEAELNALPQFITKIDGVDIHFIHVRSKKPNALPIIITHGWPGSIFELLKIIDPLTNPVAHGGKAEDAFDVVIPSLPGYGFSGKPAEAGWGPERIAHAWDVLMKRLGYTHYVAQGGDWGAVITEVMAKQAPVGLLGIHVNLPAAVPPEVEASLAEGKPAPDSLPEKERAVYDALAAYRKKGNASYFIMLTSRPQAVGYGLNDSPSGLASWILLHPGFSQWNYGEDAAKSPSKDEVLNNITLYWLTNTATSSARLYWENKGRGPTSATALKTAEIKLPVAITVFPEDVYRAPESWAKRAYPHLSYYHEVDKGGHFAAWEQPQLFAEEMRAAFKPVRENKFLNFKTTNIKGIKLSYREAGDPSKPTIVLLHGFPTSSYQFHDLIPRLANQFHILAPDYPGMGFSEVPAATVLQPTFDDVATIIDAFIMQHTSGKFILYLHDIGGPIGMRIATDHPDRIAGLIFQNFTLSVEGWNPDRLKLYEWLGGTETPEKLKQTEQFATLERDIYIHKKGALQPDALNPDNWTTDDLTFSTPANRVFMSRLFMNLTTSIQHYPEWTLYLKDHQPKTLIVWGQNDSIILPAGAEFVKQIVPAADLRYFNASHYALDENADAIAEAIIEKFS